MESFNLDQTKTIIKQLIHITLSWYSSNYTLVLFKLLLVKLIKCERPKHHKLALMQQVRSLIHSITNKTTKWKKRKKNVIVIIIIFFLKTRKNSYELDQKQKWSLYQLKVHHDVLRRRLFHWLQQKNLVLTCHNMMHVFGVNRVWMIMTAAEYQCMSAVLLFLSCGEFAAVLLQ